MPIEVKIYHLNDIQDIIKHAHLLRNYMIQICNSIKREGFIEVYGTEIIESMEDFYDKLGTFLNREFVRICQHIAKKSPDLDKLGSML